MMEENVQLFIYGAAAVLDLVLLLSMLERPNWPYIAVWMLTLTIGVWLWHGGIFVHALLAHSQGDLALQSLWASMVVMSSGLLLMPSAMLHGLHRYLRTGVGVSGPLNPWLALYYLPLLLLIPVSMQLATAPREPFIVLLKDYASLYLTLMACANIIVAIGLSQLKRKIESPRLLQFFTVMSWTLFGITVMNLFCLTWGLKLWPAGRIWLQMIVALSPTLPTLVFSYFVLRFRLLPLVVERTLTYGAIVAGAMLLHEIVTHDLAVSFQEQYRVNFGLMEGMAAIGLILVYQPLRQRFAEALRYLLGSSRLHRDQHRQLAVQLAARSGQTPDEVLDWFVDSVRIAFRVEFVSAYLINADGQLTHRSGDFINISDADVNRLSLRLQSARMRACTRYDAPNRETLDVLQQVDASAIFNLDQPMLAGLLFVGPQRFHQVLGDEEFNTLALLVEQLAATVQNSRLIADRAEAERRATRQEKLSSLGLIAGSIAHEVKNPLSSIKAIATVMAEDLGTGHSHAEDLRIILGEIDRLAKTTSQLLDVARAPISASSQTFIQESLARTVQLLSYLARQQSVTLNTKIDDHLPAVTAEDGTLREIFFNLIVNSIEAAGRGGTVSVRCHRLDMGIVVEIQDDGPGIPAAVRERLFEPLVTTKTTGTGLGLYLVSRRVLECSAKMDCQSETGQGTLFRITFPETTRSPPFSSNSVSQAAAR